MKFVMKNQKGKKVTIRTGNALYIIIPLIGWTMSVDRFQGKIVVLNSLIIWMAISLVRNITDIIIIIFNMNIHRVSIWIQIAVFSLYIIFLVKNINKYTYNKYKNKGYKIEQKYEKNELIKEFVQKSDKKEKKYFLIIYR